MARIRWRDLVPGRLYLLMLRAFIGPFVASFAVIQFLQVLLVLGQRKNDIFGKGFGAGVVSELLAYLSAWPTLESLALASLMGSLIALGSLGERYELAAIKSAGISLTRLMIPLVMIAVVVTGFAFFFSFYVKPEVNLRFWSLMFDVRQTRPAFSLKPGLFAAIADGYTMRVTDRRPDGLLRGVMIYDHTEERGNVNLTVADSGRMWMDSRTLYLRLQLYHGIRYEEPLPDPESPAGQPLNRISFDTLNTQLDLSGLQLKTTDQNLFRSHQYMLDIHRLSARIDTLRDRPRQSARELMVSLEPYLHLRERQASLRTLDSLTAADSLARKGLSPAHATLDSIAGLTYYDRSNVFANASSTARAVSNYLLFAKSNYTNQQRDIWGYDYERHLRWALPVACLLFLFVGAPLGAIIRKGGLGWPTLVGIALFVIFYLLVSFGKKFALEGITPAWFGAWMPILVLIPMAVFLMYQSATDSPLFDLTAWRQLIAQTWARLRAPRAAATA